MYTPTTSKIIGLYKKASSWDKIQGGIIGNEDDGDDDDNNNKLCWVWEEANFEEGEPSSSDDDLSLSPTLSSFSATTSNFSPVVE